MPTPHTVTELCDAHPRPNTHRRAEQFALVAMCLLGVAAALSTLGLLYIAIFPR
jgi:hypothetical protein